MASGLRLTSGEASLMIRACEERDLEHFRALGSQQHVEYCREQWSRGSEALTILVAADEKDLPLGKLHLDFETRAHAQTAVLIAAAVTPAAQGHGIGTELMRAAAELACSRGFTAIVLGVEDSNPRARRLYERLGYEPFASDEFAYVGAPVPNPGVWMHKDLEC
jgi:ribosomal protein S18 acetylase RimI-like enzyme